jgi:hypothetical protein
MKSDNGKKHPYGPNTNSHYCGDLSGLAYHSLIDIMHETGIDETMIFDEYTLAKAIRSIAAGNDDYVMRSALREIADGLDNPKARRRLKLQVGRGENSAERDARNELETNIVGTVWLGLNEFKRMKPAVYAACEKYGISYATVYKAIRHQSYIMHGVRMIQQSGFVSEAEKAWTEEQRAAYKRYEDWLYAFGEDLAEEIG